MVTQGPNPEPPMAPAQKATYDALVKRFDDLRNASIRKSIGFSPKEDQRQQTRAWPPVPPVILVRSIRTLRAAAPGSAVFLNLLRSILAFLPLAIRYLALGLLLFALWDRPSLYYLILRYTITITAVVLLLLAYKNASPAALYWKAIAGGLVVLFNPLFPVHLSPDAWKLLDVLTAMVILISLSRLAPSIRH